MKRLLFAVLISAVSYQTVYSQPKELLPIPVLKESSRVDSLLDIITAPDSKPNYSKLLQDSCIDLSILKMADNSTLFDFTLNSKRNMNYAINAFCRDKILTGYFKYKNFNVFIVGYVKFPNFFVKTSRVNYLEFVYKLENTYGAPPDGLIPHGARAWSFEYKHGYFSRWYAKVAY